MSLFTYPPTHPPTQALLRRVSSFQLHSNLLDSRLYLLAHWVLELIENKEDFTR